METDQEKLTYLEHLGEELTRQGFTVQVVIGTKLSLKVANAETPTLNERVHCQQADDGSWTFFWPWQQPIGPVDDLASVTGKIALALRSVEGPS